jgi:hypothetical protein
MAFQVKWANQKLGFTCRITIYASLLSYMILIWIECFLKISSPFLHHEVCIVMQSVFPVFFANIIRSYEHSDTIKYFIFLDPEPETYHCKMCAVCL